MKPVLYPKNQRIFNTSNGIGVLADCETCKCTEVLNKEYELVMELPVNGINVDRLEPDCIILEKPNYTDGIQPFRIYDIEQNIDGMLKVSAAHISYDAAGIPVLPFTATSLAEVESKVNTERILTKESELTFVAKFDADGEFKLSEPKSLKAIIGDGSDTIIGVYGGEVHYNGFQIELLEKRGEDKGICFRYRKNITDFEMEKNSEEAYSAVIGYWKKSGSNGSEDTIIQGSIITIDANCEYDKILLLDVSDKIKNENDADATPEQINEYVRTQIDSGEIGAIKYNMKIDYTEDDDVIKVNLGDLVGVLLPEMNIKASGRCRKVVFDCLLERNESIEIGQVSAGLSQDLAEVV